MNKNYFTLDENFEDIVEKNLKDIMGEKEDIKEMNQISTGWTNIVYKVKTDSNNYYFRFPRDEFWERTIVKDYEFAKYINNKTDYETVNLKLGFDNERPFSIHKEIEGRPLAEVMNTLSDEEIDKVTKQISEFMYQLHNYNYDEKEIFTVNNIGLELQDFIDELLKKHVSEEDIKFWEEENFKDNKDKRCLVHGDFNSSNILLDENNNVKAIIDFGFGGFGNKYYDVSRIIGRCPENFKDSFIKNYEAVSKEELDKKYLDKNIDIWNKIDNSYINYMRKIGIYK